MSKLPPAGEPVVFDAAAEYYDRTRALPDDAMATLVGLLAAELGGRGRCLEIGVGTGRMARPLAEAGIDIVGLDLSLPMLLKLEQNAGGRPFPLVLADALSVPFADDAFGSALAVHVFHLIPRWERAVAELLRVVRSGGVALVDQGSWEHDLGEAIDDRFCSAAGTERRFRGANERAEIDAAFARLGATGRSLQVVEASSTRTVEERISVLEEGLFSFTWGITAEERKRAAEEVRGWARSELGDLDEPRRFETHIRFRAYDLP